MKQNQQSNIHAMNAKEIFLCAMINCFFLLAAVCIISAIFLSDALAEGAAELAPVSTLTSVKAQDGKLVTVDLRGWDYVAKKLEEHGVPRADIEDVFGDKRMPKRASLYFSVKPRESHYNYRKLNTKQNRARAMLCYAENRRYFQEAEKQFAVPSSVVLSILQVETACGRNMGRSPVLPGLARLASAAAPGNVEENLKARENDPKRATESEYRSRAEWLENTFMPHAAAVFRVATYLKVHPLEIQGSSAGALGAPQFLPGHYMRYGVDADRDGRVDLFSAPDAILSIAHYLHDYGWSKAKMSAAEKRAVIWEYNRSQPYVDTVLGMAHLLDPQIKKVNKSLSK